MVSGEVGWHATVFSAVIAISVSEVGQGKFLFFEKVWKLKIIKDNNYQKSDSEILKYTLV